MLTDTRKNSFAFIGANPLTLGQCSWQLIILINFAKKSQRDHSLKAQVVKCDS